MKRSGFLSGGAGAVCLLLMILDSRTVLTGAVEGIQLCIASVIPSLFPFLLVSIFVSGLLSKTPLLYGTRGYLFIMGLLGGYPVGAETVSHAYQNGCISRSEAERLLAFCSNAGPAFLFGIGATIFPNIVFCWLLWGVHILSALLVALLTPATDRQIAQHTPSGEITLTAAMEKSLRAMALICGWIVLFRTVITFFQRWVLWLLPSNLQLLLVGLLELANGCCSLKEISNIGLQIELFSLFLGFGSLCVFLQTKSVLSGSGLCGHRYLPGKTVQAALSYLLCLLVQPLLPSEMRYLPSPIFGLIAVGIVVCYILFFAKSKKHSSFLSPIRV